MMMGFLCSLIECSSDIDKKDAIANDWIIIGSRESELVAFFKENNLASGEPPFLPPSNPPVFSAKSHDCEAWELFIEKGLPVLNLSLLLSILMLLIKILVEIK